MHDYAPANNKKVTFETVKGDPIQVQMHTLKNGLKLFLTVNKDEPRVYTEIAVRAGSKHDPAETTGLAHYFEHMMFKGTDKLGSLNWPKEKELLDQIEQKFEEHRQEKDPAKKKVLYAEIDRLSYEAAKFAAANEYDKLVSSIGAKGTNAYTWVEQTVYVNNIPANELERWFILESERFRRPILRLFHTELETVFEEYNISQDKDFRKSLKAMQEVLTPTHPYGTQTTLGRGEDLKNPSQTNIYRFFDQYYVPNNIALILSGDFDPVQVVQLAEQYFGAWQPKEVPEFKFDPQPPIQKRTLKEVTGHESPWIEIGWQFPGATTDEAMMLPLIAGILHNHQAGLFDIDLLQKQQLLEAYAYPRVYEDYSSLLLMAKPREGQSLETIEQLLLTEIEKLQKGEFEDWLPEAVIKDLKLSEMRSFEKNQGRAGALTGAFILGIDWADMIGRWDKMESLTKQDIVDFAKKHIRKDNYAVIYKHQGEDNSVMKVDKPAITPIDVNREGMSGFASEFLQHETEDIQPEFVDFKKVIRNARISKHVKMQGVQDKKSKLFKLHYSFDMGKRSSRELGILSAYLPFLGTSTLSPSEVQQQFYRLGLHFSANCQDDNFYISLSGLDESFEEGVAMLETLIKDAQPNQEALDNLVQDILQRRANDKTDKRAVLGGAMANYAKYGLNSPFRDKLSSAELKALNPKSLTDLLHGLTDYKHSVLYFGPKSARTVSGIVKKYHPAESGRKALIPAKKYREQGVRKDKVYFVHFPTVQVELMLISKGTPKFNMDEYIFSEWYNQYFGYGLSSIVFQEIRESNALAYSAYVHAGNPAKKNRAHWL
ncbi:MAG: insulinase family protein, partial [Lewinellaceae bacterium]|nr:insulinase family protein [Lewinellaceae bacterium]